MDRIESINRQRLLWCCAEKGISAEELALDVGIAVSSLQRLLDDGVGLTFKQLKKVADYFGRGVLFFLDTEPVDAEIVHTVQYRTLAGMKLNLSYPVKKLIERVEKQRLRYLALREELNTEDYAVFDPPETDAQNMNRTASAIRRWLGLEQTSSFEDYRAAVQAKGILVFRTNGYTGQWQIPKESSILGFSLYDEKCPVIVVRKSLWETQQTFTLMHELGHILLHHESSIDDVQDMYSRDGHEREANSFAGLVLVPEEVLATIQDSERPRDVEYFDIWLLEQRRRLGVSTEVILRRLMDVGRLSTERYAQYRSYVEGLPISEESGGSRSYRHREPKHIFGETYVRTVLDALSSRRITATKASAYLDHIKLTDLHQLEMHVASL